jgi:hypothetical protein
MSTTGTAEHLMILAAETSRFARAVEHYGLARCCMTEATIWIGLRPDPEYRRAPLAAMPQAPRSLCFVEAPDQAELVGALAASAEAASLEHLMIGTSHDYIPNRPIRYDMCAAVAALRGARWPALKHLSLGDMELLFNGHAYYGKLGDVTDVFEAAPQLDELRLRGQFTLRGPVRHDRLRDMSVFVDDIGVSGGPLSRDTVSHLLSSDFPALRRLCLSLDDGARAADYVVPDAFFTGSRFPALTDFDMDCLAPEQHAQLAAWKAGRGLR